MVQIDAVFVNTFIYEFTYNFPLGGAITKLYYPPTVRKKKNLVTRNVSRATRNNTIEFKTIL